MEKFKHFRKSGSLGEEHCHFSSVFPHFALLGEEHITGADRKITEVSFAVNDAPERHSVLGALGRIGKPSLKRKIRSRVKLITDLVGARFPDLELVTDQAVDCRNFYVHCTPDKFDDAAPKQAGT